MSKEEFDATCEKYGFEKDSEFDMWRVSHFGLYVSWFDFNTCTVSLDTEYSMNYPLTDTRLIALKEAFEI